MLHKIEVHKEIERIDFHFLKTCSIFILFIIGSSLGAKAEKYTFDVTPLLHNFWHLDHISGCVDHLKSVIGHLNSIVQLLWAGFFDKRPWPKKTKILGVREAKLTIPPQWNTRWQQITTHYRCLDVCYRLVSSRFQLSDLQGHQRSKGQKNRVTPKIWHFYQRNTV